MATVSKIPDLDSGVASPEVALTPEGSVTSNETLTMGTSSATADEVTLTNSNEGNAVDTILVTDKKEKQVVSVAQDNPVNSDDIEDEDENIDESLSERLLGLSEMFPDCVRSAISTVSSTTKSFIKGAYSVSRQIVWVGVSSSIILFAPVMFEIERFNVEEMVKQDRNRLVLGPGSAMSGPPGPPSR